MKPLGGPRLLFFHAILVALSVTFTLPFLWMVSTSMKADDEIVHDPMVWIPETPEIVTVSPYLDFEAHPPAWRRPNAFPEDADWGEFQSELRRSLFERAKEIFEAPSWPLPKDDAEPARFREAGRDLEDALFTAVRPRIPQQVWTEPSLPAAVARRIETDDVVKAWSRLYRSLGIGSVHFRNPSAVDIGVSPKPDRDRIPYDLREKGNGGGDYGPGSIVLTAREVQFASPEQPLDQIMVRIRGDASFHRLAATLEYGGKTYLTERPALLGSGEYQDVFWKFEEQKQYTIEHLRFLEAAGRPSPTDRGAARISFYLIPTSYWRAVYERLAENYREVFHYVPYATYTWVTIKITFLNILGQLIACSMVGFAFAQLRFPGRGALFVLMLSTMMLPPQVVMVPQFVQFSWIGAYNTLFPLYILSFMGAPFFIFLMRQFYKSIPKDLIDAAKIDGCSYPTIYARILLPLVKPALAAVAIFQFQNSWNEFLQPLIYITDQEKTPMSVGLFMFRQANLGQWAELMAASAMMTLPIVFLFFFTQRYFIQGVTLTGLKG